MAQFTIRVELHGATAEQYETLHQRMETAGFHRAIAGVDASGQQGWWQLPTAEYDYEADNTAQGVRDYAKIIADSVKSGSWILVTQVANRSWSTTRISNR